MPHSGVTPEEGAIYRAVVFEYFSKAPVCHSGLGPGIQ